MTKPNEAPLFARFNGNAPARREKIEKVQRQLNFGLPNGYMEFMLNKNGGEGFIGNSYLILWKIEELVSMNDSYRVAEFAPALLLFGSNGGDEAFGFYTRHESQCVVSIPFVGMEIDEAKVLSPDFQTFLSALYTS